MPDRSDTERVCVGAVAGAFGVRGEVRLKSFCADPGAIGDYGPLTSEDGARSWTVKVGRQVKNGFAARLGGVSNRDQAEALKGVRLYAPRERLPNLPDDEFYHTDLIGLDVYDAGGEKLGEVRAVQDYGAGDFLEIGLPDRKTALLPFTKEAVPTVDLAAGRLIADPPEGVFGGDENEAEAE